MADTSVVNFTGIKEKIVERVKVSFFEMLPDDQFTKMVNDEIKAFFEATVEEFSIKEIDSNKNAWASRLDKVKLTVPVSPFRAIVWNQCHELVNTKLDDVFKDDGFYAVLNNVWNDGNVMTTRADLSEKMKEELGKRATELAATFFSRMFADAFGQVSIPLIQTVKDQIRQGY